MVAIFCFKATSEYALLASLGVVAPRLLLLVSLRVTVSVEGGGAGGGEGGGGEGGGEGGEGGEKGLPSWQISAAVSSLQNLVASVSHLYHFSGWHGLACWHLPEQ